MVMFLREIFLINFKLQNVEANMANHMKKLPVFAVGDDYHNDLELINLLSIILNPP